MARHPLQYAFIGGLPYTVISEGLDDDGVIGSLLASGQDAVGRSLDEESRFMLEHLDAYRPLICIERYSRCPECEQWAPCDIRKGEQ